MYTAGVIQVYTCHHAARLQNRSRSLDKVDTTRLLQGQRHHHLHHLKPWRKQPVNKKYQKTQHTSRNPIYKKSCHIHLNLCIGLSCNNVASIFDHVLQQFTSRGRPQHRGILLFFKDTSLVANSDAVAVGIK